VVRRYEGKVAVIAGGAKGTGAATAQRLAEEGAQVIVGDIDFDTAKVTAEGIVESGGIAVPVHFDLTDEASIEALMQTTVDTFGGLDVLFNNGADLRPETVKADTDAISIDLDHWNYILQVDLTGYMLACRHAIPRMLERGGGAIVCTSSDAPFGIHPAGVHLAYSSAKLAVVALVRHVVSRWGREGIRCNCISPGTITTETWHKTISSVYGDDFDVAAIAKSNPSGRLCEPADIAGAAAFLLSDDAAGINAQVLHVNGGQTVGW
jgi:NAD(P)-dependent dehydrogenase (short-subunit alcohol dehydrogenase family)